jgi:hypothetical protein
LEKKITDTATRYPLFGSYHPFQRFFKPEVTPFSISQKARQPVP